MIDPFYYDEHEDKVVHQPSHTMWAYGRMWVPILNKWANDSYEAGREDGYKDGLAEGDLGTNHIYEDGYADGYESGYENGLWDRSTNP